MPYTVPLARRAAAATASSALLMLAVGCLGVEQRFDSPAGVLATATAAVDTPTDDTAAAGNAAEPGELATPEAAQPPLDPGPWDDPTLGNLTYTFDGKAIALENGEYHEKPDAASATYITNIRLAPERAFGDLDGDGKRDAAVILSDAPGGSGVFGYLAAVVDRDGIPTNVATAALGDRVAVKGVAITDGTVVLDVMTHGPDDPMCCPSVAATWVYRLAGDTLVRAEE